MRITAEVDISNRLLPSFNLNGKGKSARAQLSVGRKPGDTSKESEVYLMICTKLDRNGSKYKMKGNVEQIFAKFASEGKATVRLKAPPHDLCISKADPLQLKGFLQIVRMACQGRCLQKVTLSSLAPASAKQMDKLKTKMTILSRKDYPITTNFPGALEKLQVSFCCLKKIDSRILALRNLRILDLSDNNLKILSVNFDALEKLSELKLSKNQIEDVPKDFCMGCLSKTLTSLDLSDNKIKFLKSHFSNFKGLVTLKLDNNNISCLPQGISSLQKLRFFRATNNQLRTLPAGFTELHLDELDLFNNTFLEDGPASVINKLNFPTLLEYVARYIRKSRLTFSEEDAGHLYNFLNCSRVCWCGTVCFQSYVHYLTRVNLHHVAASVTSIDSSGRIHAPCEAFLCSQKCYDYYLKNPNATIWRQ